MIDMIELSKKGYAKQMELYLNNKDYQKAFALGTDFVKSYPGEMIGQYQLSSAAFHVGEYQNAQEHGRKAFNLAKTDHDMLACAIQTSLAYLKLGQYARGYEILKEMEKNKRTDELQDDLEEALFVFSVAMKDKDAAMEHIDKLYNLNKSLALRLVRAYIEGK